MVIEPCATIGVAVPPGAQVAVGPPVGVRVVVTAAVGVRVAIAVPGVMQPPPVRVYKREPVAGVPTPLQKSWVKVVALRCTPLVAEVFPWVIAPKITSKRLGAPSYNLSSKWAVPVVEK